MASSPARWAQGEPVQARRPKFGMRLRPNRDGLLIEVRWLFAMRLGNSVTMTGSRLHPTVMSSALRLNPAMQHAQQHSGHSTQHSTRTLPMLRRALVRVSAQLFNDQRL